MRACTSAYGTSWLTGYCEIKYNSVMIISVHVRENKEKHGTTQCNDNIELDNIRVMITI